MMSNPTPDKPMEKRSVVSCFIFKYPEEIDDSDAKPKVALFRRSDKVHTYPHNLAPIAGSIEATDQTPLAAAWREIGEETRLGPTALTLVLQGKPYSFRDESVAREWTVNPIAFRLNHPAEEHERQIQTDWEHEAWEWHDPLSITDDADFGGVPRLAESLRRVYPAYDLGKEAAALLAQGLAQLQGDHQSGARQLASNALRLLRDVVASMDLNIASSVKTCRRNVRMVAWHIWKNGRESMGAAVLSVLLAALRESDEAVAQTSDHVEPERWMQAMVGELDHHIAQRFSDSARSISIQFSQFTKDTYADKLASGSPLVALTLSESSTIVYGLKHLFQETSFRLDLRVLESRPLFEGASLAGRLARELLSPLTSPLSSISGEGGDNRDSARLKITLWSDASAALASAGVDLVILGADRLSSDGDVSNKTGSLPAVLSAKFVSSEAKVVVLSESEKVAPSGNPHTHVIEDNDPQQLFRAWREPYNSSSVQATVGMLMRSSDENATILSQQDTLIVKNVYFEWVPASLVDVYITERGLLAAQDIGRLAKSISEEEHRIFGGL